MTLPGWINTLLCARETVGIVNHSNCKLINAPWMNMDFCLEMTSRYYNVSLVYCSEDKIDYYSIRVITGQLE